MVFRDTGQPGIEIGKIIYLHERCNTGTLSSVLLIDFQVREQMHTEFAGSCILYTFERVWALLAMIMILHTHSSDSVVIALTITHPLNSDSVVKALT